LAEKPEGKRPPGKHSQRCENYINMDLTKIGRSGMAWIYLAQGRYKWGVHVNTLAFTKF
jgi:hypothetical protein